MQEVPSHDPASRGKGVLLIGGTADARAIAQALLDAGLRVLVSTFTEYGEDLAVCDGIDVRSGALDAAAMAELAEDRVALVDASHPFAVTATVSAREAAKQAGVPYVRFERAGEADRADGVVACASAQVAATAAVNAAMASGGAVLLTVGTRTLATYVEACRLAGVRCIARVLPVPESLEACADAGLVASDVLAMQGPTSAALDAALLRHFGATVLVTKDSGLAGGVSEKLEAARFVGATAVVVSRPSAPDPDASHSVAEVVDRVAEAAGLAASRAGSLTEQAGAACANESTSQCRVGLVHVYTGESKGKTTASVGLAVRAAGAGLRVALVQFVKGGPESSELVALRKLGVAVTRPGRRSSGLMRGTVTPEDRLAADAALGAAREALCGDYDLVVLDEACVAAATGLVDPGALTSAIASRPAHVEVVLTGRGAPGALLDLADYVTEMRVVRHPFERGIAARKGVEF